MEEYLTGREVAEMLHIHVNTLYRWIQRGQIHAVRIGTRYRFAKSELETLIEQRKTT